MSGRSPPVYPFPKIYPSTIIPEFCPQTEIAPGRQENKENSAETANNPLPTRGDSARSSRAAGVPGNWKSLRAGKRATARAKSSPPDGFLRLKREGQGINALSFLAICLEMKHATSASPLCAAIQGAADMGAVIGFRYIFFCL